MFKFYKDIRDVVSLLIYCSAERTILVAKEPSSEYWLPSSKSEKNCWKNTANKLNFEIFGAEASSQCSPLRVYKIWVPDHPHGCVYHAVYKVTVKLETKKKVKMKSGIRSRFQWFTMSDLERCKAHASLRSPEVAVFAQMASGETPKDVESMDGDSGVIVEICEDNVIIGVEAVGGGGAVALSSPTCLLLRAASYKKDERVRLYREFLPTAYPALYMSPYSFTAFMMDLGWDRAQCPNLFRAADISNRGGISFQEMLTWAVALEPSTQHTGLPAELRCRYIFRYYDSNRDQLLEYSEFKELVAAARAVRQLPVDALSVARDADVCISWGCSRPRRCRWRSSFAGPARTMTPSPHSAEASGASSSPAEALASVHHFAAPIEKSGHNGADLEKRAVPVVYGTIRESSPSPTKPARSWLTTAEEASFCALLPKLADAVRPVCSDEPRLPRLGSPVYVIGDVRGSLPALLSMETAIWPSGTAPLPAEPQRPRSAFLVRGNRETRDIQKMFTFHTYVRSPYGNMRPRSVFCCCTTPRCGSSASPRSDRLVSIGDARLIELVSS